MSEKEHDKNGVMGLFFKSADFGESFENLNNFETICRLHSLNPESTFLEIKNDDLQKDYMTFKEKLIQHLIKTGKSKSIVERSLMLFFYNVLFDFLNARRFFSKPTEENRNKFETKIFKTVKPVSFAEDYQEFKDDIHPYISKNEKLDDIELQSMNSPYYVSKAGEKGIIYTDTSALLDIRRIFYGDDLPLRSYIEAHRLTGLYLLALALEDKYHCMDWDNMNLLMGLSNDSHFPGRMYKKSLQDIVLFYLVSTKEKSYITDDGESILLNKLDYTCIEKIYDDCLNVHKTKNPNTDTHLTEEIEFDGAEKPSTEAVLKELLNNKYGSDIEYYGDLNSRKEKNEKDRFYHFRQIQNLYKYIGYSYFNQKPEQLMERIASHFNPYFESLNTPKVYRTKKYISVDLCDYYNPNRPLDHSLNKVNVVSPENGQRMIETHIDDFCLLAVMEKIPVGMSLQEKLIFLENGMKSLFITPETFGFQYINYRNPFHRLIVYCIEFDDPVNEFKELIKKCKDTTDNDNRNSANRR